MIQLLLKKLNTISYPTNIPYESCKCGNDKELKSYKSAHLRFKKQRNEIKACERYANESDAIK